MATNFALKSESDPRLGNYIVPDYVGTKVAVDFGANTGLFEKKYNTRFENIYYFEADHYNFLKATAGILSSGIKNCFGFNLAISGKTGDMVNIYSHNNGDSGSKSIINTDDMSQGKYHKILTICPQDVLKMIGTDRIDYLKVDIEGAEFDAFENFDFSVVDFLAIELHTFTGFDKLDDLRNTILKTHEIVLQKKAIPNDCHEEVCFKIRSLQGKRHTRMGARIYI